MSGNNNPLGDRGKAEEERWAREQDAKAIEELKKKNGDKGGSTTGDGKADDKTSKQKGKRKGCGCGSKK